MLTDACACTTARLQRVPQTSDRGYPVVAMQSTTTGIQRKQALSELCPRQLANKLADSPYELLACYSRICMRVISLYVRHCECSPFEGASTQTWGLPNTNSDQWVT